MLTSDRKECHDTGFKRQRDGTKKRVKDDWHITVYGGDKLPLRMHWIAQGHIYVAVDQKNVPIRIALLPELKITNAKKNPEFWFRREEGSDDKECNRGESS